MRRTRAHSKRPASAAILSERTHLSEQQINTMLRCYAERRPPRAAAQIAGISLNTIYINYHRIRYRLAITRYYTDGALSFDDEGLSPEVTQALRSRRGIRKDGVFTHAAEVIAWAQESPPRVVLKHIRKIIELTGPLDRPPQLSETELSKLRAYVEYARTELVYEQWKAHPDHYEEVQVHMINRAKNALARYWRAYRASSKRLERDRKKAPMSRSAL